MNDVLNRIGDIGIVPVVKIDDAKNAVPLAKALLAGGLPVAEITFRTGAAKEAIMNITSAVPEMLVGAGTVLSVDQVKSAVDAGAKFIVSPGFNPKVVGYCVENNIPVTPGCCNPSDIEMAMEFGLEVVKFFPAESYGGLSTIKAISAPYGNVKFIPTGGVDENNLADYISFPKIWAVGGSWMVKPDLINAGKFDEITAITKQAVNRMLGFELAHIGINTKSEDDAKKVSGEYSKLFNMPIKEGNSSIFAGTGIEVNKSMGLGLQGHIAIKTNSIKRAIAYFKGMGVEFDEASAKMKNDQIIAIYLKNEIGGFAVHLLQK